MWVSQQLGSKSGFPRQCFFLLGNFCGDDEEFAGVMGLEDQMLLVSNTMNLWVSNTAQCNVLV